MKGGGREGGREDTFRSSEMDNVSILFEHVYLFNGLDGLDIEFLEGGLQFFVVGAGGFVDFLLLPSWCAFAAVRLVSIYALVRQTLGSFSCESSEE